MPRAVVYAPVRIRLRVEDSGLVELLLSTDVASFRGEDDSLHLLVHLFLEVRLLRAGHPSHLASYLGLEDAPFGRPDVGRSFFVFHQHCNRLRQGQNNARTHPLYFCVLSINGIIYSQRKYSKASQVDHDAAWGTERCIV